MWVDFAQTLDPSIETLLALFDFSHIYVPLWTRTCMRVCTYFMIISIIHISFSLNNWRRLLSRNVLYHLYTMLCKKTSLTVYQCCTITWLYVVLFLNCSFNLLKLPEYPTKEVLKERLNVALTCGSDIIDLTWSCQRSLLMHVYLFETYVDNWLLMTCCVI